MFSRIIGLLLLVPLAHSMAGISPARADSPVAPATFSQPSKVATDGRGTVYVADPGDHTIKKLSSDGTLLAVWHAGSTSFQAAWRIAADAPGNVYVPDGATRQNGVMMGRITKLSPSGAVLARWYSTQLRALIDLAAGPGGSVFVLESESYGGPGPSARLIKLSPAGKVVATWSVDRRGYDFATGDAVTVDAAGYVYATMRVGSCSRGCQGGDAVLLEKFSNAGKKLAVWTLPFGAPEGGLGVDSQGNLYLAGGAGIEKLTATGQRTWTTGAVGCGPGQFRDISSLAADGQGTLYVTDRYNKNVQKLSSGGQPLALWGGCPAAPPPPVRNPSIFVPSGVSVDGSNNLYIADREDHRVTKLSPQGSPLVSWSVPPPRSGADPLVDVWPYRIAVDRGGTSYLSTLGNAQTGGIVKLSPRGEVLARWGGGALANPLSLAAGGRGNVFALYGDYESRGAGPDAYRARIVKLSPAGKVLATWYTDETKVYGNDPSTIAVDAQGNVYVSIYAVNDCTEGSRGEIDCRQNLLFIHKLSPAGKLIGRWGGVGAYGLASASLAVDRSGNMYLGGLGEIVKVSPAGKQLARWPVQACGRSEIGPVTGIAVDGRGIIYASTISNHVRYGNGHLTLSGSVEKLSSQGTLLYVIGGCPTQAGSRAGG